MRNISRLSVKVGDLVKLIDSFYGKRIGVIIACSEFSPGWHTISCPDEVIHWPETQLEVISEK